MSGINLYDWNQGLEWWLYIGKPQQSTGLLGNTIAEINLEHPLRKVVAICAGQPAYSLL